MDRIWQWAWDRYGARYSWAIWAVAFASSLAVYLVWSFLVVTFEKSSHYVEAAVVTGVAVVVMSLVVVLPGSRRFRLAQRWAAGDELDREAALKDTYTWARAAGVEGCGSSLFGPHCWDRLSV
jgi:adenylate cyclase